jgi:hypothetical protein
MSVCQSRTKKKGSKGQNKIWRTKANSGSRFGSTPNSKLLVVLAPPPLASAPPGRSCSGILALRSPARMGEIMRASESSCVLGGTTMRCLNQGANDILSKQGKGAAAEAAAEEEEETHELSALFTFSTNAVNTVGSSPSSPFGLSSLIPSP